MSNHKPAILGGLPLSSERLEIVRPSFPDLSQFEERFSAALKAGSVTNNSPAVVEFERQVAEYTGCDALVMNNGQSALMIMLRAADITSGEVIVPSYTFSATPHAVAWCGATPVFADIIGNGQLTIDPDDVERRITDKTVAILGVDVYGIPCEYERLEEIGKRHGIKVLYDSAPAFGSRVNGKPIGAFGDAQVFSFHATKAFTTMEGGALTSQDKSLIERARAIRNFGQVDGAQCDEPGTNAKLTEVCALVGLEQLKHYDQVVQLRVEIGRIYGDGLEGIRGITMGEVPHGSSSVWLYFPIILDPAEFGLTRDELAEALEYENIFVRKYFELPCHHLDAYKSLNTGYLKHTEEVAYNVVALPVYNNMTNQEAGVIVEAIQRIHAAAPEVRLVISK